MLDTRFLRAFHVACESGGFSRAATRLNCTQPAVTYQVRALERALGTKLFERGGRKAVLTPAGRRMYDFSRRYFAELAQLAADVAEGVVESTEPLRIAAVSGFGRYVLFPMLTALVAREEDAGAEVEDVGSSASRRASVGGPPIGRVRLDLRFRTAQEVLRQVEDGDVELGVVYLPKVSNYLTFHPIHEEELVLIAAPAVVRELTDRRDPTTLSSYLSIPFITYLEGDYVFGRWFESQFGSQPASTMSAHHFDELEEVVGMVALGHGASITPLDAARLAVARGDVHVVRPFGEKRRCINQVFAVTRAGSFVRHEVEVLLDALRAPSSPA